MTTCADLMIGRCPAMQEVYKAIGRVAQKNIPVLIRGESGMGMLLIGLLQILLSNRSCGCWPAGIRDA